MTDKGSKKKSKKEKNDAKCKPFHYAFLVDSTQSV